MRSKISKERIHLEGKNTHNDKHGEPLVGRKVAHGCKKLRRRRVKSSRAVQPLNEQKKEVAARGFRL